MDFYDLLPRRVAVPEPLGAGKRTTSQAPKHSTHFVKNQSDRFANISAIAVHSTESQDLPGTKDDLVAIRNWFNNPTSSASSHIEIDGSGNTERWVPAHKKAWTILDLNSVTLNIEFVGRAAQAGSAWEEAQIKAGARWVAFWAIRFDIPIRRGAVKNLNGNAVISRKGIIRHSQLTNAGFGSHTDPGKNFPMQKLIDYARFYKKNGWVV